MKSAAGFHILRIFGRLVGLHALVALQSGCLTKPLQAAEVACQDLFGNPVYCCKLPLSVRALKQNVHSAESVLAVKIQRN